MADRCGYNRFWPLANDVRHSQAEVVSFRFAVIASEMDQERFETRLAISPFLQAEEDIR